MDNLKLEVFQDYLITIENKKTLEKMKEILIHIRKTFPQLKPEIKWNQPMFTDHGTFIIAFSISKNHISMAPEYVSLEKFREEFIKEGYKITKMLVQIPNKEEVNFELLDKVIGFNIEYKKDFDKFWLLPPK